MMYPFMTLNDKTEIVHSEALTDDQGREYVRVYIERPIMQGFQSAECRLPDYTWVMNDGFSQEEIDEFQKYIESIAHVIIQLARDGGFENASGF